MSFVGWEFERVDEDGTTIICSIYNGTDCILFILPNGHQCGM